MLRSMYSGISGMKNFQTKLDVIGNNIANVNTYGFKKGRVTFKDMVSQTISGASAGDGARGGVNPKQVGLGSQLASIDTVDTQGSLQTTGRVLDLGIQGDGYLIVEDVSGMAKYTRAGNLFFDNNGYLVTASGDIVQGYNADGQLEGIRIEDPETISNLSIGEDGVISYKKGEDSNSDWTIAVARFPNNGGLEKVGENYYIHTNAAGAVANGRPTEGGAGKLVSGTLEMSNVDLSEEFTEMIVTQRGFQANTRIITTSDEILQELVNLKR
ncbi:MAG TPA: flagellar hook-basal body complex protein [Bacillus bacterium]|uniref:Flagellar hook protein FlgE n=1 Tax=Siminovitchia fordii TaxID=254759 RepID=A0ABQ4JZG2_9BACI|nr:flagellar basal body rod protein FlgG [Siminovitchia fordii]GIN18937.1 flagellar basal-body rod protein FlgG [Siminovitchia fordii]HBZ10448.1 flagellar hook-basal body complex protein [Bacillus sp. (in: firmicutes)]